MIGEAAASVIEAQFGSGVAIFLIGVLSATLGSIVAVLAYRGYTRNQSAPMLYLSVGVALLTVVPFVLSHAIAAATAATDADILLVITTCNLLGLLTIAHSLRRT